jgi:hypothetical protein
VQVVNTCTVPLIENESVGASETLRAWSPAMMVSMVHVRPVSGRSGSSKLRSMNWKLASALDRLNRGPCRVSRGAAAKYAASH